MSDELTVIEGEVVQLGMINATGPQDVIVRASAIATELAKIIKQGKLFTPIQGKEFVRVEGWNTLGAMLGILPRERYVKTLDNGFEAYVELVRASDGAIVGGASAVCTRDERNWSNRDEYAVRSMAVTRATGKAFRLAFSWIMALAGYEPTPAEEMTFAEPTTKTKSAPKIARINSTDPVLLDEIIKHNLAENAFEAKNMMLKCAWETSTQEKFMTWATVYRGWRDSGLEAAAAAEKTNNGERP